MPMHEDASLQLRLAKSGAVDLSSTLALPPLAIPVVAPGPNLARPSELGRCIRFKAAGVEHQATAVHYCKKQASRTNRDRPFASALDRALAFAAMGWPVFPLAANKRPLAGSHSHKDATRDPRCLTELFRRRSAKLIGIPTGEASGIMVVDVDPRHGGDAWETGASADGLLDGAVLVKSPHGRHYYFRYAPQTRCSNGKIAVGVDIKTEGGYVACYAATPSFLANVRDAPAALVDLIRSPFSSVSSTLYTSPGNPRSDVVTTDRRIAAYIYKVLEGVRTAPDGSKHDAILLAGYTLGRIGSAYNLSPDVLASAIFDALAGRNVKSEALATRAIADGLAAGWANPRELPARGGDYRQASQASSRRWLDDREKHRDFPPGMKRGNDWFQYNAERRSDCLKAIEAEAAGGILPDDGRAWSLIQIYGGVVALCVGWDLIVSTVQTDLAPFFSVRLVTGRVPVALADTVERARMVGQGTRDRRFRVTTEKLIAKLQPSPELQQRLMHIIDPNEKNRRRRARDVKVGRVHRPHEVARAEKTSMGAMVSKMRADGARLGDIANHLGVSLSTVKRAARQ
jgi:hypothetical protein